MKQTMILVSGSPATGKTTLATELSERLNIPVFYRDRITEVLWDAPSQADKIPNQFGPTSAEIIFHIIEQLMKSIGSFVIESYWHYNLANDRLLKLKKKYSYNTVTIRLFGKPEIIYNRFIARQQSTERHAGLKGGKQLTVDEFSASIEYTGCNNINIGGKIIDVDTTDFNKVSIDGIISEIEKA